MSHTPACPQCGSDSTYPDGSQTICIQCSHEWIVGEIPPEVAARVLDSNGTTLAQGDTVVVIKNLKVKGSSIGLKQGAVTRSIRLIEGDIEHIEGHSDRIKRLVLKTCFLRKA